MRALLLAALLASPMTVSAEPTAPAEDAAIRQAIIGQWVGVLEYRDYSEPPTSTKRVALPTWLTIADGGKSLSWKYIYDDGPGKVLDETDVVTFDLRAKAYSESSGGKPALTYTVTGYETLKDGRGVLVLLGTGTDNDKPSETRVTMTIRRNLLEIGEEVRAAGSTDPFAFRHTFRFTRAQPPAVTEIRR